jgi:hypothetical protein
MSRVLKAKYQKAERFVEEENRDMQKTYPQSSYEKESVHALVWGRGNLKGFELIWNRSSHQT